MRFYTFIKGPTQIKFINVIQALEVDFSRYRISFVPLISIVEIPLKVRLFRNNARYFYFGGYV